MIKIDFNRPPEEAIKYLKQKGLKLTFNYDEMIHEEHHKAFTVAKVTKLDLLSDIQKSLIKAQEDGIGFDEWKRRIKNTLIKHGWFGKTEVIDETTGEIKNINVNSRRLSTIFHTNMRVSYQVGRYDKMKSLKIEQYWRYVAILDTRVRPDHAALHGMIRHRDDPFWEKNYPPNAWNCRCKVQAYSKRQIEKNGWKIQSSDDPLPKPYKGPHKDWAYNPGKTEKEKIETLYYDKTLKKMPENIKYSLSDIAKGIDHKKYTDFIDNILKDKTYPQNEVAAGYLDSDVFEFLKEKGIIPATPHIWLTKKALVHMTRQVKKDADVALTIEEIKRFSKIMAENEWEKILYDKSKKNVVYIFPAEKDSNKIAVEINYKVKSDTKNVIITSGKVFDSSIKGLIGSVYEVIKSK